MTRLALLAGRSRLGIAAFSLMALAACGGGTEDPPRVAPTAAVPTVTAKAVALAPLTVTSSVPGDGGNNAARTLQPSFTFSSLLNQASVNAGNFTLRAGTAGLPAAITVVDRVARLAPAAKLLPQTQFTVRAEPGILDLSGQTLAAPVQRSFVTADATWKDALPMPGATGVNGPRPALAFDSRGGVIAAWHRLEALPDGKLYVSRYDPATGAWSAPLVLFQRSTGSVADAKVALDAADNVVLVWRYRAPGGRPVLWSTRYSPLTGAWEEPRVISEDGTRDHSDAMPQLAVRANGEVVVAWRRDDAVFMAGTTTFPMTRWTVPHRLDNPDAGTQAVQSMSIAMSPVPGGPTVVAWSTPTVNSDPGQVWARVFDGYRTPGATLARLVSRQGSEPDTGASVTITVGSGVYAVWRRQNPGDPGSGTLWSARFDGATWSDPRAISGPQNRAWGVSVASNTEAAEPATWVTWLDASTQVMATRLRPEGPETPRLIGVSPTPMDVNQRSTHVVDSAGNVLVLWTTGSDADARVMASRYVARLGAWQTVRTLDQRQLAFPYTAALAVSATGDAVAAWHGLVLDALGVPVQTPMVTRRFD